MTDTIAETATAWRLEKGEDGTGVLWFDLPGEKVNKFTPESLEELKEILDSIAGDRDLERLIVASAKENIFIAGADVSRFREVPGAGEAEEYVRFGQRVFGTLAELPQITCALIHGACMGGGTELSLNCDYRLVTDWEKSIIALPEVKLGIIPAWGGTTRLPRLVGIPAALDMILTGKNVRARKAKKIGLVDDVIPSATRVDAARAFLSKKASKSSPDKSRIYLEGNPIARKLIFDKARSSVVKETRGHYPAPLRAIDVMQRGFEEGVDAGLRAEARAAAELITGEVAPNLVNLFFMMEQAKKHEGPTPEVVNRVGVLGAGLMGGGIAQTLVDKADVPVRMKDINWDALSSGMKAAGKIWKKKLDRKHINKVQMDYNMSRISPTTDWKGFERVDVVIEAVVEKIEVKQAVMKEVEEHGKDDVIFATNTSTIPITQIAAVSSRPERVIGMHFFSPVDKMPLVEVIAGEKTSEQTVSTIHELGRRMGKTVVVCKDGPGFIVNRILGPYVNEAGFLLEEGNSVESIDEAMVDFGMPLGPLALLDEVGIDVAGKAAQILVEAFGDRMQASKLVERLLSDERYGKKNGRGVYVWKDGKREDPDRSVYPLLGVSEPRSGSRRSMVERMVLSMINEASRVLDEGIASSAADIDLAMIMGTGFPPFRGGLLRYADRIGLSYVVERLRELSAEHGSRFEPSPALVARAEAGKPFFD